MNDNRRIIGWVLVVFGVVALLGAISHFFISHSIRAADYRHFNTSTSSIPYQDMRPQPHMSQQDRACAPYERAMNMDMNMDMNMERGVGIDQHYQPRHPDGARGRFDDDHHPGFFFAPLFLMGAIIPFILGGLITGLVVWALMRNHQHNQGGPGPGGSHREEHDPPRSYTSDTQTL
jgi:hypothetical protein